MSQYFRNIMTVFTGILSSRALGLLRNILMAAYLGISTASNAFIFAFMVPNLSRRFLGEGELSSAVIPIVSQRMKKDGSKTVFHLINEILTRALVVTILGAAALIFGYVVFLSMVQFSFVESAADSMKEQWKFGAKLGILMALYMPLICLTALCSAILNIFGKFGVSSLTPIILNVVMIAALVFSGSIAELEPVGVAWILGFAVVFSGVLQLCITAQALWREGWRPKLQWSESEDFKELKKLLGLGMAGAGIISLNVFIVRLMAFGLDNSTITVIHHVDRLVQLPIGLFAISATTVLFPKMSTFHASGDMAAMSSIFKKATQLILIFAIPASVGLVALGEPILISIFQWGKFGEEETAITLPLLRVYALAIPFYSLSVFILRSLHAQKNMTSPLRAIAWGSAVNVALSILLIGQFKAMGLAWANLVSIALQVWLMRRSLGLHLSGLSWDWAFIFKMVLASFAMGLSAHLVWNWVAYLCGNAKLAALLMCVAIPLFAVQYFILLWLICPQRRKNIIAIIKLQRLDGF